MSQKNYDIVACADIAGLDLRIECEAFGGSVKDVTDSFYKHIKDFLNVECHQVRYINVQVKELEGFTTITFDKE